MSVNRLFYEKEIQKKNIKKILKIDIKAKHTYKKQSCKTSMITYWRGQNNNNKNLRISYLFWEILIFNQRHIPNYFKDAEKPYDLKCLAYYNEITI